MEKEREGQGEEEEVEGTEGEGRDISCMVVSRPWQHWCHSWGIPGNPAASLVVYI